MQYLYDPGILASSANQVYPWESVSEIYQENYLMT